MTSTLDLRLGIDVGGTNTDAVILDRDDRVVAKTKQPTTLDVTGGIEQAIAAVLAGADVRRITHVMLSTTHATNAVVERRRLHRVAVLRVGKPSSLSVNPMFGWPPELVACIGEHVTIVDGGFEYDGRPIVPFDHEATRAFLTSAAGQVDAVAISSVYSPVSPEHELEAAEIAREVLGASTPISLSHEVGSLGLLERENATILNAALTSVAGDVAAALRRSLETHGVDAAVLFAQNDGTLMALDYAVRFPILTIGSGPANSIRGAAFLTGLSEALVADVGGTTTDLGMLVSGFPRASTAAVEIGGVRTNFRMPDVLSIALGGGTVIRQADDGGVLLGPDSVGYQLRQEALVFGGSVPTMTDAITAEGRAEIGSLPPAADRTVLRAAVEHADVALADAVDRVKTGRAEVPLIVVGGGSALIPDELSGVSKVLRPEHSEVANAIGAAIAQVSGRWDEVVVLSRGREAAIASACEQAKTRAIESGADPDHLEIVQLDEIPLAYLTEPVARITAKAVGPLGRI